MPSCFTGVDRTTTVTETFHGAITLTRFAHYRQPTGQPKERFSPYREGSDGMAVITTKQNVLTDVSSNGNVLVAGAQRSFFLRQHGMKPAFDEIIATAVKRQHEPSASSVICSTPRSMRSRHARSSTSSPSPSCRSPRTSTTSSLKARRSTRPSCVTLPAASSSPSSATQC